MSRRWCVCAGLALVACMPVKSDDALTLDLGDLEDYSEWLEYEREAPLEPIPFKADPLVVEATGTVRAVPDIAVIVATIEAKDANESRAVDRVSDTLNQVQSILAGRTVETGFTSVNARPEYPQDCLNERRAAQRRHQQIVQDYWFNRRLDEAGDTETRRRPPRPRIVQPVCQAEAMSVSTVMTVRVSPAEDAGAVLDAMGQAGAERARLYGYDFSDYDSLYQTAAEQAVRNAQAKARSIASLAQGELGELVDFQISPPNRVGRFGPQPTVIRPDRPRSGDGIDAIASHLQRQANGEMDEERRYTPPPPPPPPALSSMESDVYADEIVVTGSRIRRGDAVPLRSAVASLASNPGSSQGSPSAATASNALTMSLMSGPQTIRASATLSYDYDTPLDGTLIIEPSQNET